MELTEGFKYPLPIDEVVRNGGIVFVAFKHEKATSAAKLGLRDDTRVLGCCVETVNFEEITEA